MSAALESARSDWEDGNRRLSEAARDHRQNEFLHAQVELLLAELRRRLGAVYTMQELVETYMTAERWAGATLGEQAWRPGWARTLSMAVDTAFHRYQRGAQDYQP